MVWEIFKKLMFIPNLHFLVYKTPECLPMLTERFRLLTSSPIAATSVEINTAEPLLSMNNF